jgi:hypothetical protein
MRPAPGDSCGSLERSGQRAAALRAYDDLADYLRRECEGEPSAETRKLAAELKARVEPQVSPTHQVLPAAPHCHQNTRAVEPESVASRPSKERRRVSVDHGRNRRSAAHGRCGVGVRPPALRARYAQALTRVQLE